MPPEGNIPGTVACQYVLDNGVDWAVFYKETEDGSADGGKTGWVMRVKIT